MFQRMMYSLQRFMYGRNGVDPLCWVLVAFGLAFYAIGGFTGLNVLCIVAYVPLIFAMYRMFSKKLEQRRKENSVLMTFWKGLTDRDNRYYSCPNCKQTIRVPKGKGRISIHCPRCGEKFIRKT